MNFRSGVPPPHSVDSFTLREDLGEYVPYRTLCIYHCSSLDGGYLGIFLSSVMPRGTTKFSGFATAFTTAAAQYLVTSATSNACRLRWLVPFRQGCYLGRDHGWCRPRVPKTDHQHREPHASSNVLVCTINSARSWQPRSVKIQTVRVYSCSSHQYCSSIAICDQ